jgi:hypothetical protein
MLQQCDIISWMPAKHAQHGPYTMQMMQFMFYASLHVSEASSNPH